MNITSHTKYTKMKDSIKHERDKGAGRLNISSCIMCHQPLLADCQRSNPSKPLKSSYHVCITKGHADCLQKRDATHQISVIVLQVAEVKANEVIVFVDDTDMCVCASLMLPIKHSNLDLY